MKDDVHIAMYSDLRGIAICQMLNVEGTVLTSFVQARATGDLTSWKGESYRRFPVCLDCK